MTTQRARRTTLSREAAGCYVGYAAPPSVSALSYPRYVAMARGSIIDMRKFQVRRYVPSDMEAMLMVRRDSILNVASRDCSAQQILAWVPDEDDHAA